MRKIILLTFIVFLSSIISLGETIVKGNCTGGEGYIIRIITLPDFISGLERTLAVDTISEDGSFEMTMDLDETIFAMIDVEFQDAEIYLKKDITYQLEIYFNPKDRDQIYYDRTPMGYSLESNDPDSLNMKISSVNQGFDDFVLEHFEKLYKTQDKNLFYKLKGIMYPIIKDSGDDYLLAYVEYRLAGLEQAARLKGRETLAKEYLTNKPVLYNNIEYFYFFAQFFEKYLLSNNGEVNYHSVHDMFLENRPLNDLRSLIRKDPLLDDPRLSEFFLLDNLKILHYNADFNAALVRSYLEEISETSDFPQHRQIALNILESVSHMKPGSDAPPFSLPDAQGAKLSLSDFAGKVVYLYFFLSQNSSCIYEQDMMIELKGKLPPEVAFVGISADKDIAAYQSLARSEKYPWILLHYDNNIDFLESYNAVTYPLYLILDKEGKIAVNPAPRPSENPQNAIISITRK